MNAGNNVVGVDRILVGVDDISFRIKVLPRVETFLSAAGIFVVRVLRRGSVAS